jgi:two-component system chemotaxis response regulator CheY
MKFLVVDDSVTMRRILINSLQRVGEHEFVEAADGDEALKRYNAEVDFVITDWNMPVCSGLEFVRQLRSRPDGQSVPILMVTTRSAREDLLIAVDAGVNNYILKPFTTQTLKEKIDALLGNAGLAA